MKRLLYILPFIFFSQLNAQSYSLEQKKADYRNSRAALDIPVPTNIQKHFDIAIDEIDQMLKRNKPLSFKRAVYLVENAYYEGQNNWEEYNNGILRIKLILDKMIDNRNLRRYKTAGKHRDEQGNWWNLEITTGSFSRSSFIMEMFNVSEAAIESGLFMKSLSDIESVAYCIYELICYYEDKTGRYSDDFVRKCYEIGLQYYPNSQLQIAKGNDLKFRLDNKMTDMGLKGYREIVNYPELLNEFQIMESTFNYVTKIGYSTMNPEDYEGLVNDIKNKQKKLKSEE